eukprot:1139704-Prymnesium_polylepis.1
MAWHAHNIWALVVVLAAEVLSRVDPPIAGRLAMFAFGGFVTQAARRRAAARRRTLRRAGARAHARLPPGRRRLVMPQPPARPQTPRARHELRSALEGGAQRGPNI